MQPVRRTSLIAQVTEQLRAEIRSGRWAIGSRIPTEPELTELTGTGRNTVREAVQALVHAGMLERRQGSGTYVIAASEVGGTLGKYFADAEERDVLELRLALDTTAAALAARRRDDADIANLRRLLEERSHHWDADTHSAIAADVALHRAIVVASHNAVYLEFYDSLLPTIEQVIRSRTSKSDDSYDAEHNELVQAVVDGDADRAAQAARCFLGSLIAEYPDAR
ncbi:MULTISPECIES: FadR/GntR family transcriptional regulator [Nocardia]|uniref:Transcriptional regulator, GntR family n=2 Tax=Nocardia TaxID=1817 RepID=A0A285L6G2_9NOCA|nr:MULTISPECIES: FCD domain-containing protein [Nocardia]MCP2274746.1 transcriptional regulator, GntR family [Nocardia amikacinitolerans]MCP2289991.1 transcriptional regulator, GntR family [Nocardia amikacinitolerans]MCP2296504.1 transcriptional regulator, GntR family [Nocardia amikacinitolerans]MCP2320560.1 transcriptional regulator, GntR family [Nocardia amikacinitolerans]TQM30953.1 GntR family transcriptional regulator [Nocardia bhagyanarayanae]